MEDSIEEIDNQEHAPAPNNIGRKIIVSEPTRMINNPI